MSRVWTTNQRQSSGLPQLRSGNRRKNHEMPPMWGNLFPRPGNVPQLPPLDTFKRTSSTRHQYASGSKPTKWRPDRFVKRPGYHHKAQWPTCYERAAHPTARQTSKEPRRNGQSGQEKKSRTTHHSVCHRPCHLWRLLLLLQQCQEQQRDGIVRICHEERRPIGVTDLSRQQP